MCGKARSYPTKYHFNLAPLMYKPGEIPIEFETLTLYISLNLVINLLKLAILIDQMIDFYIEIILFIDVLHFLIANVSESII